jgi:GNAT superfamily N-acetyltransferase
MREAAQWLIDSGKPMWELSDLEPERFTDPDERFIVLWRNGEGAAAVILSMEDDVFWPDIRRGTSGFLHKLAVRRKYAGQGIADILIDYASERCLENGVRALRLDCDPARTKLRELYERHGFTLKEIKTIQTKRLGEIDVALYEKFL